MTEHQCGDHLDKNNLPDYYCEFVRGADGGWDVASSSMPGSSCYCSTPSGSPPGPGVSEYYYPCCGSTSRSAALVGNGCWGTYRFQRGQFFVVGATSSGGHGCPLDLPAYSRAHAEFSFAQAVEFATDPASRGTYVYQNGTFTCVDQTGGQCPQDLVAYSQQHPDFHFLVTIRFEART